MYKPIHGKVEKVEEEDDEVGEHQVGEGDKEEAVEEWTDLFEEGEKSVENARV